MLFRMGKECGLGWRNRGLGLLCFCVLLLHSQQWLVVVTAQGGVPSSTCPSLPASLRDTAWKEGLSTEEVQKLEVQVMRKVRILTGTFKQGTKVLFTKPPNLETSDDNLLQGAKVLASNVVPSEYRNAFEVTVSLSLGFWPKFSVVPVGLRGTRGKPRARAGSDNDIVVTGEGLYDSNSGTLCVTGCIGSVCKYKVNLNYPSPTTIHQVSVLGNLSSTCEATEQGYFDPISITAISDGLFAYTQNDTLDALCPTLVADVGMGKLWNEQKVCKQGWSSLQQPFQVIWDPSCEGANCNPFVGLGTAASEKGFFLRFDRVHCDGDRVHGVVVFTEGHSLPDRFADPSSSDGMLVFEGVWNRTSGQLCMLACRLYGTQDCKITITMQFPLTLTITERALVVGHVRSLRDAKEASYFMPITFRQLTAGISVSKFTGLTSQPEYVYSKVEKAKQLCYPGGRKLTSTKYPSGEDWRDLEFHALKDPGSTKAGHNAFVNMNLFTVGNQFRTYGLLHAGATVNATALSDQEMMNVSYSIYYQMEKSNSWETNLPAEGVYDPATGRICLIGCQFVDRRTTGLLQLEGESAKDCQIFLNIQVPALDTGNEGLKGSVTSLRSSTDPLYFKPESFSGMVRLQAIESVWRIDLEIVMSVLMLSLTVLFIVLQLIYSKQYPDTLPYISTSMLLLLSLAHMIPLVLNFEALFQKKTDNNGLKMPGGWPEANEVIVRLTTMAAMLLQLRVFQLVWKARNVARREGTLAPAVQERQVLYTILPLYAVGGLVEVLIHSLFGFKPLEHYFKWKGGQGGLWWGVKAYGGLLLDFHLFPQVVGNILWGAKEQAPLSKPFYFGMAFVRSLPHIYDLCRRFQFLPAFSDMYLYANPEWDFYSITSDVLIPCGILLLAILVYMQQRWGGRCVLPRRWRGGFEYEKVSSIGT